MSGSAKSFPRRPSKLGRSKQSYCVFDISAAEKNLGYEPAYDVARGVRDYVITLERLGR